MKYFILIVPILFFSNAGAVAKDVSIGMGNFEPYYIAKGQTGIFTDIITAVFRKIPDHQPSYRFGRPNKRLWKDFKEGKLDAVSNLFDSVQLPGCRSDHVFRFRDVAITKKTSELKINTISDLNGKRIITFQGAKSFFGDKFANFTSFKAYTEVAKPKLQARMLFNKRADVSVGDMFIFLHNLRLMGNANARPIDFEFHSIFPATSSRMGFREGPLCAKFNEALKLVRESGEYETIYQSYLKNLGY